MSRDSRKWDAELAFRIHIQRRKQRCCFFTFPSKKRIGSGRDIEASLPQVKKTLRQSEIDRRILASESPLQFLQMLVAVFPTGLNHSAFPVIIPRRDLDHRSFQLQCEVQGFGKCFPAPGINSPVAVVQPRLLVDILKARKSDGQMKIRFGFRVTQ